MYIYIFQTISLFLVNKCTVNANIYLLFSVYDVGWFEDSH